MLQVIRHAKEYTGTVNRLAGVAVNPTIGLSIGLRLNVNVIKFYLTEKAHQCYISGEEGLGYLIDDTGQE